MIASTWLDKVSKPRKPVFQKQNVKCAFLMPSYRADCVRVGLETGSLTKNTELTLCENDRNKMQTLQNVHWSNIWPTQFKKPRFENCDFANVHLRKPHDLMWFDLCGNLSFQDFNWIRNHATKFILPNADIAFTFDFKFRGNAFLPDFIELCKKNSCDYINYIRKQMSCKVDNNHVTKSVAQVLMLNYLFGEYTYKLEFYPYDSINSEKSHVGKHILFILRSLKSGSSYMPLDLRLEIKGLLLQWTLMSRLKLEGLTTKNTVQAIKSEASKFVRLCAGEKPRLKSVADTIYQPSILNKLIQCSLSHLN